MLVKFIKNGRKSQTKADGNSFVAVTVIVPLYGVVTTALEWIRVANRVVSVIHLYDLKHKDMLLKYQK